MANLRPTRRILRGGGVEALANSGRAYLRNIENMGNLLGIEMLDNAVKNALSSKTLFSADGSYVKTRRGPSPSVDATAAVARRERGVVVRPRPDLYVCLEAYDESQAFAGYFIARLMDPDFGVSWIDSSSWIFVNGEYGVLAPTNTSDSTEPPIVLGRRVGRVGVMDLFDSVPSNRTSDDAAIDTNIVYQFSDSLVETTEAYPEGRWIPGNVHPWAGEQALGVSYYFGSWWFRPPSDARYFVFPLSADTLALGSLSGYKNHDETTTVTMLRGTEEIVALTEKRDVRQAYLSFPNENNYFINATGTQEVSGHGFIAFAGAAIDTSRYAVCVVSKVFGSSHTGTWNELSPYDPAIGRPYSDDSFFVGGPGYTASCVYDGAKPSQTGRSLRYEVDGVSGEIELSSNGETAFFHSANAKKYYRLSKDKSLLLSVARLPGDDSSHVLLFLAATQYGAMATEFTGELLSSGVVRSLVTGDPRKLYVYNYSKIALLSAVASAK